MEYTVVAKPDGTIEVVPVNKAQGIMVPAYETSQLDLVDQINQGPKNIGVPMTLEETMAGSVLPPDPRRFQSIFNPQATGIMQQAPDFERFEGITKETDIDDDTQDVVDETKQSGGLQNILRAIMGFAIPGAGLITGGLESLRGFNDRLRNTDFGQATSLADYFDMKKYGGAQGRRDAAARNMAQARGIQKKIDAGDYGTRDTSIDRGRGNIGGSNRGSSKGSSRSGGFSSSARGAALHG